ncbi:jg17567, partial [Pararge aegeria aegeria]
LVRNASGAVRSKATEVTDECVRSEPRGSRVFGDVERFVELERVLFNERADPDFNITSVLVDCHRN